MGKLEVSENRADGFGNEAVSAAAEGMPDSRTEAINALIALGYTKAEAFAAVAKVAEEDLSCEDYIKKALKNLF